MKAFNIEILITGAIFWDYLSFHLYEDMLESGKAIKPTTAIPVTLQIATIMKQTLIGTKFTPISCPRRLTVEAGRRSY